MSATSFVCDKTRALSWEPQNFPRLYIPWGLRDPDSDPQGCCRGRRQEGGRSNQGEPSSCLLFSAGSTSLSLRRQLQCMKSFCSAWRPTLPCGKTTTSLSFWNTARM